MTQEELSDVPITPLGIGIEGQPGKYRIAKTVNDLAGTLLGDWHHPKDDIWRAAVSACIRAFEAQTNGDAARAAFILAADDAELPLIVNSDNLWPRGAPRDQPKRLPQWKARSAHH
ncbi:hypothetical protein A6U87_16575 [Rhizobium sp. AC44/96]|uniref:DUF982 domain-containing protein n=1 Tax=Rhizobium sp. AC44/96 TaxID=1841654 RepID=UPI00080F950A|nr:DUF982 domain-containing protein [Rhizobium sp. AC44/96]OCJ04446.1 hypothetical protein A6U87_16575 [Rhizobium sp. AC44/96]